MDTIHSGFCPSSSIPLSVYMQGEAAFRRTASLPLQGIGIHLPTRVRRAQRVRSDTAGEDPKGETGQSMSVVDSKTMSAPVARVKLVV